MSSSVETLREAKGLAISQEREGELCHPSFCGLVVPENPFWEPSMWSQLMIFRRGNGLSGVCDWPKTP